MRGRRFPRRGFDGLYDVKAASRPAEAEKVVEDAINYNPKTIWLQLGITSENGDKFAKSINANYVQDSCIKTEYERIMKK